MSLDATARAAVDQTKQKLRRISLPDSGEWVRRARRRRAARRAFGALLVVALVAGSATVWAARREQSETVVATQTPNAGGGGTADGWARLDKTSAGLGELSVINDVTTGGPGFVAVGAAPASGGAYRPAVWTSRDGRSWERVEDSDAPGDAGELAHVASGPSGLVAVGIARRAGAIVWRSSDGEAWEEIARGSGVFPETPSAFGVAGSGAGLIGIIAGGPGLIAYGAADNNGALDAAIWTSRDGAEWTRVLDDPPPGRGQVSALTATNDGFVALGSEAGNPDPLLPPGVAWTSPDGVSWTRTGPSNGIDGYSVAMGVRGDQIVSSVGDSAALATEPNPSAASTLWESRDGGRTWARVSEFSAAFPSSGVAELLTVDDTWLAAGVTTPPGEANHVDAWTSADARTWTPIPEELHDSPGGVLDTSTATNEVAVLFGAAPELPWFYVWDAPRTSETRSERESEQSLCGAALPRSVAIPTGYEGPEARAVDDAPNPATASQLVLSWAAASASLEARWPADPAFASGLPLTVPPVPAPSPGFGASSPTQTRQLPDGRYFNYVVFQLPDQRPECQLLQLTVFDTNAAAVGATIGALLQHPFETDDPLVSDSRTVDSVPTVSACPTPPGVTSPNRGGPVQDTATYASAAAALEAFVSEDQTLPSSRYVEMQLPDGSITYGWQIRESNWVVLVHVVTDGSSWAVDSWSASGC